MNHLSAWCEAHLRRLCEAMNPDLRLYVIIGMLLLFAALSLYTTLTAIGNIGRSSGNALEIAHLRPRKTSAFVVVWFLDFLPATHMLIFKWSMARSAMVLIL